MTFEHGSSFPLLLLLLRFAQILITASVIILSARVVSIYSTWLLLSVLGSNSSLCGWKSFTLSSITWLDGNNMKINTMHQVHAIMLILFRKSAITGEPRSLGLSRGLRCKHDLNVSEKLLITFQFSRDLFEPKLSRWASTIWCKNRPTEMKLHLSFEESTVERLMCSHSTFTLRNSHLSEFGEIWLASF